MAKGFLIVSVYDNSVAKPIGEATVIVTGENYKESFTTDINGKTPIIELEAPLKIYSLIPQSEVKPYSVYSVEVSKSDYQTTIVNGVQILPEETALQSVYLIPNQVRQEEPKVIDLPPHTLWEDVQRNVIRNDYDIETNNFRVYPQVLVPEYVIVHDGAPNDTTAANYYVPFTDYIKNVTSGEIYSTWPRESLKANIYAIISFTLNRIYTEWYKSRGYNFTVTSSPSYDQLYVRNRTTYKNISDIVDEVFNTYIQLPNKDFPFLAQYNDGISVNNPGWLSQWGSKNLADQGYTAPQILKYYYTSNLTLPKAANTVGLPLSFPGYNLAIGSCGEPVQKIQIMLNTISGSYPAIPKISPADGRFGTNTRDSVKMFQEVFELPNTGVVDFATWYKISYIYVAVKQMLKGV